MHMSCRYVRSSPDSSDFRRSLTRLSCGAWSLPHVLAPTWPGNATVTEQALTALLGTWQYFAEPSSVVVDNIKGTLEWSGP